MKFLCQQCKAKYQIADEKVQGKTLRMKCRKCSHVIEIRALSDSVIPPSSGGDAMRVERLSEEMAAAPRSPAKPFAPNANATTPTTGAARTGLAPRPAPRASVVSRPTDAHQAVTTRPGATGSRKEPSYPESALAKAFASSVAHTAKRPPVLQRSSTAGSTDPPAEEWYVAIDDVPVGPIRLTELRAKYGQSAVDDDSLVWREGFEEWRPLHTLVDLYELVKEDVSGASSAARASLLPQAPARAPQRPGAQARQVTPAPAIASTPRPASPAIPPPSMASAATPTPAAVRGNVIPFSRGGAGAAARKLEDPQDSEAARNAPQSALAEALAGPSSAAKTAAGYDRAAPKITSDPFGFHTPPPSSASATRLSTPPPSRASISLPRTGYQRPERPSLFDRLSVRARGVSKPVVALVGAGSLLLGVVLTVLVVRRMVIVEEKIVERQVMVPGSVIYLPAPVGAAPSIAADPAASTRVALRPGGNAGASVSAQAPVASPTSGGSKKLGGLDLGPEGPEVPGVSGARAGGAPLDGSKVESVVAAKRVSVRKNCYEPYVDKGSATARIVLHIQPDGSVSAVDLAASSGDSAIGSCVQRLARGWRFPASESGGTFVVPFIFST